MDSSQLLGITTFAYLFAALLYVGIFVFKTDRFGIFATVCTALGLIVQTAGLGLRWYESYEMGIGHAPLTNMYESVVFFAWTIIFLYLVIEWKFKTRVIGAFTVPFAVFAMAYASLSTEISTTISPLVPALQSNWLIAHVVTCFISYAAFTLAAGLATMYLLRTSLGTGNPKSATSLFATLPAPNILDDLTHKSIIFGFIWLSAGIITGAIWANSAWGTYWSWDPKEVWSLITWLLYAFALHARFTMGWNGTRIAWLAIIGLAVVIFTYYGVNFLLSGLHSYGSS